MINIQEFYAQSNFNAMCVTVMCVTLIFKTRIYSKKNGSETSPKPLNKQTTKLELHC